MGLQTAFKQVANNARASVATAPSPATSGTSLVVASGKGALFPSPGNGFYATIWNKTSFPDPTDDTSMEIVLVTARSTDTFTITRAQLGTAARTVTTSDTIALLDVDQLFKDYTAAINKGEASRMMTVDAAGNGDYTTIGAAVAAGYGNLRVLNGTYNESAGTLNSNSLSGKSFYIVGEDRENTIINLNASTTGFLLIDKARSVLQNLTIKPGNLSLSASTQGWVQITAANVTLRDVNFVAANAANTGAVVTTTGTRTRIDNCRFSGGGPSSGSVYLTNATATECVISNCAFEETRNVRCIFTTTGVNSLTVTGCTFNGGTAGPDNAVTLQGNYHVMTGNQFNLTYNASNTSNYAVDMNGSTDGVFSGNLIKCGHRMLTCGPENTAAGNVFVHSGGNASQVSISIDASSSEISVVGNTFIGDAKAIVAVSAAGTTTITGNRIKGYTRSDATGHGTGIQNGGIVDGNFITSCTRHYYRDSTFYPMVGRVSQMRAVTASTASTTLDLQQYRGFRIAISANTTFAFTEEDSFDANLQGNHGVTYELHVVQDATGSHTYAWPASVIWQGGAAPTGSGANKIDIIWLKYDAVTGKYYGWYQLNF